MNKAIMILAFAAGVLFLACSADGLIRSNGSIDWSDDNKSSPNIPSSSSNGGSNNAGYCLVQSNCYDMSGYGITLSQCTQYGGSYYSTLSSCEAANGGGYTGSWCVNHYYEDCSNCSSYLANAAACKDGWGYGYPNETEIMASCPSSYDKNNCY
ncbi:MAG: hypothetical protein FWC26_11295 [Fibromonadales bacterium]|nr:hypothetical protein [Fibromonadales bacterium]